MSDTPQWARPVTAPSPRPCTCGHEWSEAEDFHLDDCDFLVDLGSMPSPAPAVEPATDDYVPLGLVNPGTDAVSRTVYALIFSGLTHALAKDQWMPLSERSRVTSAIYDSLRANGVEVRLGDGLTRLAEVAQAPCDERLAPFRGFAFPAGHNHACTERGPHSVHACECGTTWEPVGG